MKNKLIKQGRRTDLNNTKKPSSNTKPLNDKKIVEIEVDKLNIDLCGVTLINDKPRLVKNALPYELIEAEEQYCEGIGKIYNPVRIIEPSEFRVKPKCKSYEVCGNCNLLHMQYERQCKEKVIMLKKYLRDVCDVYIDDCVRSPDIEWRNKLHLAFDKRGNRVAVGFINEETHKVVEITECKMHGEWFSTVAKVLVNWAQESGLEPYIPAKRTGILRFAVARKLGNAIMLTVVSRVNIEDKLRPLYNKLCEAFGGVSLYLNVNDQHNSMVFSDKFVYIAGEKRLDGEMLGINYSVSPRSFLQTNEYITEKIYSKITDIVKTSGCNTVIDLYSGIGITSMLFAKTGKNVISIETVKEAVEDAKALAEKNRLSGKIKMLCGDCKDILPTIKTRNDAIFFVDPPRKGLGFSVCRDIINFAPKKIIYLSCGPESLAEDLSVFIRRGYVLKSVTPYDMFPNTKHVETLVCLEKKNFNPERYSKRKTGY